MSNPLLPFYGAHTFGPAIMDAIASQLVNKIDGMTVDRVIPSVWFEEVHLEFPPADRFITLFHSDFPVDQRDVLGGGAINTAFDSTLEVNGYTRVEADLEGRSIEFYRQQASGVYSFAQQIITALQMFSPPDPDDATLGLLRRPMRIRPGWNVKPKSGKANSRWGVIQSRWEVSFVADLSTPYP